MTALLEATGIRKAYPGVRALSGVDFRVDAGEVHALLGENGAGKSTLMKVIAGSVDPDAGELTLDGSALAFGSPEAARDRGVATVFQELSLVPSLTVGENILLGRWPTRRTGTVDWPRLFREAADRLRRLGVGVDVRATVRSLGMAERQLVEIAKALREGVRILLLDEPTSALSAPEAHRLFGIVRDLQAAGVGIVYVSHMLAEVLEIADRITVLRDGDVVGTVAADSIDEAGLARMMVGRSLAEQSTRAGTALDRAGEADGEIVLRVRSLARPPRLRPVDFELRRGEIVAVFGLVGAGRTRLARTLFGLEPATEGTVEVFGRARRIAEPVDAIAAGIGYLGDDRSAGVVPGMSIARNITLARLGGLGRGPLLDFGKERELAARYVAELGIRPADPEHSAGTLSGGNQQKVVLARWLCSGTGILVLDDAMRGVDVGAKEEIIALIRRLAEDGIAMLYLTSEIKEARLLAGRLLVMAGGRIVREVAPDAGDDEIVAAAGGGRG